MKKILFILLFIPMTLFSQRGLSPGIVAISTVEYDSTGSYAVITDGQTVFWYISDSREYSCFFSLIKRGCNHLGSNHFASNTNIYLRTDST